MKSHLSDDFIRRFQKLPTRIKNQAKKSYKLWKSNPKHPGLEFKLVGKRKPVYSARIAIGWRVLGYKHQDIVIWFWIGSHTDYEKLLKQF